MIIYALWRNNAVYDIAYKNKYTKEQELVLPLGSASIEDVTDNPEQKNSPANTRLHKVNIPSNNRSMLPLG